MALSVQMLHCPGGAGVSVILFLVNIYFVKCNSRFTSAFQISLLKFSLLQCCTALLSIREKKSDLAKFKRENIVFVMLLWACKTHNEFVLVIILRFIGGD